MNLEKIIGAFVKGFLDKAVVIINNKYEIVYVNDFVLSNTCLDVEEIVGKSLLKDFYEGEKFAPNGEYLSPLIRAIDTGYTLPKTILLKRPLRILPCRYYESHIMLTADEQNKVMYAIGCYTTLDKEKKLEKKFNLVNKQIIEAMAATLDARDSLTGRHSYFVANLAWLFGKKIGLSREESRMLYLAGLMHDIGKIGVPESILTKKGLLTGVEYAEIKKHPVIGENILMKVDELKVLSNIVRHHHERYDGTGYPDGLKGENIPFFSRVLMVCDAFEAMLGERAYKSIMTIKEANMEIKRNLNFQFDPYLGDKFINFVEEYYRSRKINNIMRERL